ncbi:hypothetical protein [Acinetobacter larvae]|uniref:Uncharacterized protein n=1 Tax=Acinetobacter larvae TaxID=1789224 RepID=A0A1B2LYJ0_9GAMM|nr:hypothetical protein [Acinetobacter larvae]AOA57949.1 hypothetical protein BFG52_06035 [Acinetobacter larvae]
MFKYFFIIILLSMFVRNSIAKEYIYSDEVQILPEAIQRDDQIFMNYLFSYFNPNNILESDEDYHTFKTVVNAKINVSQLDVFKLKVNVLLKNDEMDWFIPRFEEKSIYSENKIYLIGKNKHILKIFPEWWSYKQRGPYEPIVYSPKPENIGLFARFNKGDQYKLEYIIEIPNNVGDKMIFDLFYLDDSMPTEIFTQYHESHDNHLPNLATKSNIIKVSCHAIDGDVTKGFKCDFSDL